MNNIDKKKSMVFCEKYINKMFNEENIENITLDIISNKIKSISPEDILKLLVITWRFLDKEDIKLNNFRKKIDLVIESQEDSTLFEELSNYIKSMHIIKKFFIEENLLQYINFDEQSDLLSENDKILQFCIDFLFDTLNEFFSNCTIEILSEFSDELLIFLLGRKQVNYSFISNVVSNRKIDIDSISGYALVNLLHYYNYNNRSLCKKFAFKIFEDKKLFHSINDTEQNNLTYHLIFSYLDKSKDVFEYMISKDELLKYTSDFYTLEEVKTMFKDDLETNPKYIKWFYEISGFASELEIFEYLISNNDNIDYEKVCAILNDNLNNIFYENYSVDLKLNKIVKMYKSLSKNKNILNEQSVELCCRSVTEIVLNDSNKDIILTASDEDLKYFLANSFIQDIHIENIDIPEIIEYLRSKEISFYKDLQKYRLLNYPNGKHYFISGSYVSILLLIFDKNMIEKIDDEECILSILSIAPEIFSMPSAPLITPDIINKADKFREFDYSMFFENKTSKNLLHEIFKYRIDDFPRNRNLIYAISRIIEKPVSDEDKELIFKLKDASPEKIADLINSFDFLASKPDFVQKALEWNANYIFRVDKQYQTPFIVSNLDLSQISAYNEMKDQDINFLFYMINSGILELNEHLFITIKKQFKDFYTRINSDILSELFSKYMSYVKNELIKEYPQIIFYLTDELYGYVSVFGFNETLLLEDYKLFFNRNGATDELKSFLANNSLAAYNLINDNIMHIDSILENPTKELFEMFTPFILKEFSIDEKKLNYCLNIFGYKMLFNLNNKNLIKFLKSPVEDCEKIFELIKNRTVTPAKFSDVILDNLIQSEFTIKNKAEIDTFSFLCNLISHISVENLNEWYENNYNNKYTFRLDLKIDKISRVLNMDIDIIKKAVLCSNADLTPLREICTTYVSRLREEYRASSYDFASKIGFAFEYDKKSLEKILMPLILNKKNNITFYGPNSDENIIIPSFEYEGLLSVLPDLTPEEFDIIYDIIYKNYGFKVKSVDKEIIASEGKSLKNFISKILNKMSSSNQTKEINDVDKKRLTIARKYLKQLASDFADKVKSSHVSAYLKKVKRIYNIELSPVDYLGVICDLDIDIYLEKIYPDKEVFDHLKKTFDRFYLGQIPYQVEEFCKKNLGICSAGGMNNVGNFIIRYHNILQNKKNNSKMNTGYEPKIDDIKFTFSEVAKLIEDTNSLKKEIILLMGEQEYTDFVTEAKPNKNNRNRSKADQKLIQLLNFLYSVEYITIPPKDEILQSKKSNKKINIIVGNRTNTVNLCHGERTGSCWRRIVFNVSY